MYLNFVLPGDPRLGEVVDEVEELVRQSGWEDMGRKIFWPRAMFWLVHASDETEELVDEMERTTLLVKGLYAKHFAEIEQEQQEREQQ